MTTGSTAYLVDTNIFIYAYMAEDVFKSQRARQVLGQVVANRVGCVSTQVLNELFSRLTRGVQNPAAIADSADTVRAIVLNWLVLETTQETVQEAIRGVMEYQLSYWDSLIWAAARLNRVPYVLSEDFSNGQTLEAVTFLNPLADGFALERQTV